MHLCPCKVCCVCPTTTAPVVEATQSKISAGKGEILTVRWPCRSAKAVKDSLRERGWLDRDRKIPQALLPPSTCVFPLLPSVSDGDEAGARAAAQDWEQSHVDWLEMPAKGPSTKGSKGGKQKRQQQQLQEAPPDGSASASSGAEGCLDYARFFGSQRVSLAAEAATLAPRSPAEIERIDIVTADRFAAVRARGEPVVLCGVDWGPCVGAWTPNYLAKHGSATADGGDGNVAGVHVCSETTVDLAGHRLPGTPKNFAFHEMPFSELIQRCSHESFDQPPHPPLVCEGERYYLRSVVRGTMAGKVASDLSALFPRLSEDVRLNQDMLCPPGVGGGLHSSVLRISSGQGTMLWPHYDTMDNVLVQVTGRKRVVLWPPSEDQNLYTKGSSCRVPSIDIFDPVTHPRFKDTHACRLETTLGPGEAVYIPSLWFHAVQALDFSAAVNIFWKGLPDDAYPPGDVYGNKDLVASGRAMELVQRAAALLKVLPEPHRSFYSRRAAAVLHSGRGGDDAGSSEQWGRKMVCVVTGGAGVIGREVCKGLLMSGAAVVVGVRGEGGGGARRGAAGLREESGSDSVWGAELDTSDAASIRRFAAEITERFGVGGGGIDLLVNCAAVVPRGGGRHVTQEGLECQFSTNALGLHRMIAAFKNLLCDRSSENAQRPSVVVNVASEYAGGLEMADLEFSTRKYSAAAAYRQSKQVR